jgi:hypothetical protein
MGPEGYETARARQGVVLRQELGDHPGRAARSAGLRRLHAGSYLAQTQPVSLAVHLAALVAQWGHREVFVLGRAALWLHGYGERPETLVLGVPQSHELAASDDVKVRRVAPSVIDGWRWRHDCKVVSLETAVVQIAAQEAYGELLGLVEELVRSRRTTLTRLRARCRRGLKGSAALRRVCDELAGGSMDRDVRRLHEALVRRGVTEWEVEARFVDPSGRSANADLFHRPTMTAVEVDGLLTHATREGFRRDRRRDRWLRRDHGVTTLRVDVTEIREDVDAVADELVELLGLIARDRRTA